MIEQGLTSLLQADAGMIAAVAGRIYPVEGPPDEPTYPYVAYRVVSSHHENTLDLREMSMKTIQFDCFGQAYGDGKIAIQALRNALVGFTGALPDGTVIQVTRRGNEMDNFAFDQRVYHSLAEYEFEYTEA